MEKLGGSGLRLGRHAGTARRGAARAGIVAVLAVLAGGAQAAGQPLPYSEHCLGSDALEAAKALYLHDYDFAAADPAKSAGLLDPRLGGWLAKNWDCEKDGVCALETDSWTGAQDGAVTEPIAITLEPDAGNPAPATEAEVRFAFRFDLGDGQKPTPESTILHFTRGGDGQCWTLLDMTSARGDSLLDQLSHYQYYP